MPAQIAREQSVWWDNIETKDVVEGVIAIRKDNKVTVKVEKDCLGTELTISNLKKE